MKRKSDEIAGEETDPSPKTKKSKGSTRGDFEGCFRKKLFAEEVLKQYTNEYTRSEPYKHAIIQELMNDSLLRKVRSEIRESVHFTPKETDIYRIHQSGDLANLDGLDDAALSKLPSLLKLRDALYSPVFRKYIATVTNSGELSGRKTDMAINVYTPGCHLLCHDDAIGSRRVSYILYLTDPDIPWQAEWGGALRLYPTSTMKDVNGEINKTPSSDFSKSIPPVWNQLSFFAVQPGQSFHDVEEVYHAASKDQQEKEGGRIRIAISGWYHIPQIGEDGYIEGAAEKLTEKSSLVQLQGKSDRYDLPREHTVVVESPAKAPEDAGLEAADIDFLLKYMAPTYLTPDTMEQVAEHFTGQSSVTLYDLLSTRFAGRIRDYIEKQEASTMPPTSDQIEKGLWNVARPPHKHRFLYLQQSTSVSGPSSQPPIELSPIQEILDVFLPSHQFRLWLELATECEIESYNIMARRFRRGLDYDLATSHEGKPRLELSLGLTPTTGWGDDDREEDDEGDERVDNSWARTKGNAKANGKAKAQATAVEAEQDDVGGQEVYMAGDDEADGDAAVYKSSTDTEDDNILFTVPAAWNKMSIVLRDSGVLRFVKYVSRAAKGDRWDVNGVYGVKEDEEGDEGEGEGEGDGVEGGSNREVASASQITLESSDEEEFTGFPKSDDSESD